MSATSAPWKSRRVHPKTSARVVYGLHAPLAVDGERVEYVAVSHGSYGDTGIFPCDAEGKITDFTDLWMEDHAHIPHDVAFIAWFEEGERPGFMRSLFGIHSDVKPWAVAS